LYDGAIISFDGILLRRVATGRLVPDSLAVQPWVEQQIFGASIAAKLCYQFARLSVEKSYKGLAVLWNFRFLLDEVGGSKVAVFVPE
jgi:hypothetical protein